MRAMKVIAGKADWSIEQGDVLEYLHALPADSCNLVFGSPPYEAARTYSIGFNLRGQAWLDWMVEVYRAAARVCVGLVAFVVEGQTADYRWSATPALLMADLHRAGLNLRRPPIFHRVGIPGSGGPDWLRADTEYIVCISRPGRLPWSDNTACGHPPKWAPSHVVGRRRVVRGSKDGDTQTSDSYLPPVLANPGNLISCKVGGNLMGHPSAHQNEAPFPLKLAEFFVRSFCPPDGVVCDPFSGSCTTGHAAVLHGRRFIGCDLRATQVGIGRRRLKSVSDNNILENNHRA